MAWLLPLGALYGWLIWDEKSPVITSVLIVTYAVIAAGMAYDLKRKESLLK